MACGDSSASKLQKYLHKDSSVSGMAIKVVTAAAETGSADAVRLVAPKLTGDTVVVMSGDTITDIAITSVLATHQIRNAGVTTVLSKNATSASANTKLGKAPKVHLLKATLGRLCPTFCVVGNVTLAFEPRSDWS